MLKLRSVVAGAAGASQRRGWPKRWAWRTAEPVPGGILEEKRKPDDERCRPPARIDCEAGRCGEPAYGILPL